MIRPISAGRFTFGRGPAGPKVSKTQRLVDLVKQKPHTPAELARKLGGHPDSAHSLLHQKKGSVPGLRYAKGFWEIVPPAPKAPAEPSSAASASHAMQPLRGYMQNLVIREGSMDFLDIPSMAGGRRVPR